MAKPGPKPKPTHLKIITGNPGKRPLNHDEPEVIEPLGTPPAGWQAGAKRGGRGGQFPQTGRSVDRWPPFVHATAKLGPGVKAKKPQESSKN